MSDDNEGTTNEGPSNEGPSDEGVADLDAAELEELRAYKIKAEADKAAGPPPPAPVEPLKEGDLVVFKSEGAYGATAQHGLVVHDPDDDDRVTVVWFAGRSGLIASDLLEKS